MKKEGGNQKINSMASIGFMLGLFSVLSVISMFFTEISFDFLVPFGTVVSLLAVVFSIIGLNLAQKKHDKRGGKMATIGLILGIIFAFIFIILLNLNCC